MAQPYPIVGIKDTGVQPRLEIRDLQEKPIHFSLFIQALNKIFDVNSSDANSPSHLNNPISWWQIGAIHGLPYEQWSGDPNGPSTPDPNSEYGGYCYHASALFPTWHRVLLLLTEQAIVRTAIDIVKELQEKDPAGGYGEWVQAAKELRHPYWDWTKEETATEGIPKIFQDPQVLIAKPGNPTSGSLVRNPLNHYRYAAKPGIVTGVEYMDNWTRTYRWVDNGDNPKKEQYDQALRAYSVGTKLNLGGGEITLQPVHWLRGKVSALFQYPLTIPDPSYGPNLWGHFSNTAGGSVFLPDPIPSPLASIEESHNMVHLDTGGNGSMSINEYAAFDPIFYMHHANVDRIWAFWEYVYPEYWIGQGWKDKDGAIVSFTNGDEGNFQQDPDAPVNNETPLIPFRSDTLNYWTSDATRGLLNTSPTQKYYTYPAIKDPRTGVEVKVDAPYDTSDTSLREEYRQVLFNEWSPQVHNVLQAVQNLSTNLHPQQRHLLVHHEPSATSRLRHFVVQAKLPEFAFSGSYRLELYVRPKNAPQSTVHVVNSTSVLARGNPEKCAACKDRRAAGTKIRGYMPLDPRIVLYLVTQLDHTERAVVTDLDKLSIVVKESIGTRLVKPDGTILAVANSLQDGTVLEEAKAPELSLYSHVITFDHTAYRAQAAPAVKFEEHTEHGGFGDKSAWKVISA